MSTKTFQESCGILKRPRRNRKSPAIRSLVQETKLSVSDLVLPLFIKEGTSVKEPISSLPNVFRLSLDSLLWEVEECLSLGVFAIALFPVIERSLKDSMGSQALDEEGITPRAIRLIKERFPEVCLIADVALDPYTSHGHDGLVNGEGVILNDETIAQLIDMSLVLAETGVDIIAPSDMMDGRIRKIRNALDANSFLDVSILSYSVKYASSFYGPFREALFSTLEFGDKKTYQMDPANKREAVREAELDEEEGADILMIKPALPFLDVIAKIREISSLPLAAYHVSGEYAMLMAAHLNGWIDGKKALMESLISIKRAGADMIFSYGAKEAASLLLDSPF